MNLFWSIICPAALWATVACSVGLILNAFPAREVFERGEGVKWGSALLFCFVLWMVAMAHA